MLDLEALKKELTPQQYAAVTTTGGPILIIAGAGSGNSLRQPPSPYRCSPWRPGPVTVPGIITFRKRNITRTMSSATASLKASAAFLASLPTKPEVVNLLVYHDVGIGKHARLGTEYNPAALHMEAPSEEVQQHALDIMRQYGLNTKIGG